MCRAGPCVGQGHVPGRAMGVLQMAQWWNNTTDLPDVSKCFRRDSSKHPCQRPPCYFAWGCFRYFGWKREPRPEERPLGRVSKDGRHRDTWFETAQARLLTMRVETYLAGLGSIGVVPRTPSTSSSNLAPARSWASPRGGATICSPTGRPDEVNPHGNDSAGQQTSVIA